MSTRCEREAVQRVTIWHNLREERATHRYYQTLVQIIMPDLEERRIRREKEERERKREREREREREKENEGTRGRD